MSSYDLHCLEKANGSWNRFLKDWENQCNDVGDGIEDYAPDALSVLRQTIESVQNTALSKSLVAAVYDGERYVAACYLNWAAMLPKANGPTLRVRQIVVSPLVDYGQIDTDEYGNILVSLVFGVVKLSESILGADSVKLHLRSPHDMLFFKAFGNALDSQQVFASVKMQGAWLYIEKSTGMALASNSNEE